MNIDSIEDKIVSHFENQLDQKASEELLALVQEDKNAQEIWDFYQMMYQQFDTQEQVLPSTGLKKNYNKWLSKQQVEPKKARIISLRTFTAWTAVASVFVLALTTWNINRISHKTEKTLADVQQQNGVARRNEISFRKNKNHKSKL